MDIASKKSRHIGTYIVLLLGTATVLIPFAWMVLTAFKTYQETMKVPIVWFPAKWSFENFAEVLNALDFVRYYGNTIIVTLYIVVIQLLMCSLTAYAFARMEFRFKKFLFGLMLVVFMVPPQMTLIPKYRMVASFGWVDTLAGIIIPSIFSAYTVFMLRQFFASLPNELEDAAHIDGCSHFRIYWNIMLPLVTSGLVAIGMLNVLWSWNELLWPLIIAASDNTRVLAVAIATLQGGRQGNQYHLMMAASSLSMLPMVLLYLVGQKFFIAGISQSGIKG
jgi:multiple sugar transport system permease protein